MRPPPKDRSEAKMKQKSELEVQKREKILRNFLRQKYMDEGQTDLVTPGGLDWAMELIDDGAPLYPSDVQVYIEKYGNKKAYNDMLTYILNNPHAMLGR